MMRLVYALLVLLLLTACSSVVISPKPQAEHQIDNDGQRIGQTVKGVHLTATVREASIRPAPIEQNYCSFWVELTNQRNVLLPLSISDFLLIDTQGHQYKAADPDELLERLTLDAPYLIPYPYVGFYYLQDSFRSRVDNLFTSESRYFASRSPDFIKTDALPIADILPSSTVVGTLYFPAELRNMEGFQLRYQIGHLPGQKSFQISLPFTVEKK